MESERVRLGRVSERYEVGKRGAATISSGRGDHGGVSYGSWQLSSKTGSLMDFLKKSDLDKYFKNYTPGTNEFNKVWRELAKESFFEDVQYEYIKENYYDKQLSYLKRNGIDLYDRGIAVQEMIWSTAVQFGAHTSLIRKALRKGDYTKLSDIEIIRAVQERKIMFNSSLFRSSITAIQKSVLRRAKSEMNMLISLSNDPKYNSEV